MYQERGPDLGPRDVGVVVLALVSLAFVLPVQLGSMIVFDSTGLDVVAPDFVFMVAVPALAVTAPVLVVARRRYGRRTALAVVTTEFLAGAALAAYLVRFYGVCGGPGC